MSSGQRSYLEEMAQPPFASPGKLAKVETAKCHIGTCPRIMNLLYCHGVELMDCRGAV